MELTNREIVMRSQTLVFVVGSISEDSLKLCYQNFQVECAINPIKAFQDFPVGL